MHCTNPAPGVWLCGSRPKRKRCSTPNCGNWSELECDHPVTRKTKPTPERGDARLHREHKRIFYVWHCEDDQVSVSQTAPGLQHPVLQHVTVEDWFAKTDATCNRPICRSCAVRVGELDYCGAHGRAVKQLEAGNG